MTDAYFANATYYRKVDPQEIIQDTSGKNNESSFKPLKLRVKHDIKVAKDKPTPLPDSVAQNFILPLAHLLGAQIDPYQVPFIFLPEGPIRSTDHSGPILERELKNPDCLLPHMKLAPQLLQNSSFNQ